METIKTHQMRLTQRRTIHQPQEKNSTQSVRTRQPLAGLRNLHLVATRYCRLFFTLPRPLKTTRVLKHQISEIHNNFGKCGNLLRHIGMDSSGHMNHPSATGKIPIDRETINSPPQSHSSCDQHLQVLLGLPFPVSKRRTTQEIPKPSEEESVRSHKRARKTASSYVNPEGFRRTVRYQLLYSAQVEADKEKQLRFDPFQ
ncbi:hypothetical protein AVEN_81423-1 [Araneus ventricosus]|uniref:Uncharacterized protein n=1 Tax=Araneus ventricosus TaxID=182803 RepID=A0A4Y2R312_ARAVE|nr:hypothetical protein AVEN_81423-1 [Araneus ventricosus]